jgi:cysteinyl-tRNA synthetase
MKWWMNIMPLLLTNSYTRQKEIFTPRDAKRVSLYVCGPTVYNRAHIGNARPAVVFDVLARLLRTLYGADHVVYARNITDIDDKINAAAKAQGVPISTITQRFEAYYLQDMAALGVAPPNAAPHATEHIDDIITLCQTLIAKGHAYATQGHVLFHVPSFAAYGALSKRTQDELLAGARVEVAPYKQSPSDFVLWKPSPTPDLPGWESPWGRGRPGWHIECSAMIQAIFGDAGVDIHGGGQDLIFPHHENEIAQSEAANNKPLARYWLHNGFLSMDSTKMSKSLGNVVTVDQLLAQGHKGEVLRLALLSAHYRQPLNWSDSLIEQSKNMLDRLYGFLRHSDPATCQMLDIEDRMSGVYAALLDDLNTPLALSELMKLGAPENAQALKAAGALMGLLQQDPEAWFKGMSSAPEDAAIETLIAARAAAKAARNWAQADQLRAELKALGIVLEDTKEGTTLWRRA